MKLSFEANRMESKICLFGPFAGTKWIFAWRKCKWDLIRRTNVWLAWLISFCGFMSELLLVTWSQHLCVQHIRTQTPAKVIWIFGLNSRKKWTTTTIDNDPNCVSYHRHPHHHHHQAEQFLTSYFGGDSFLKWQTKSSPNWFTLCWTRMYDVCITFSLRIHSTGNCTLHTAYAHPYTAHRDMYPFRFVIKSSANVCEY